MYIYDILLNYFAINISDKGCNENQKRYLLFN